MIQKINSRKILVYSKTQYSYLRMNVKVTLSRVKTIVIHVSHIIIDIINSCKLELYEEHMCFFLKIN